MILITGATGKLGSQVIQTLIDRNLPTNQIVALVRDETKAAHLKAKGIPSYYIYFAVSPLIKISQARTLVGQFKPI